MNHTNNNTCRTHVVCVLHTQTYLKMIRNRRRRKKQRPIRTNIFCLAIDAVVTLNSYTICVVLSLLFMIFTSSFSSFYLPGGLYRNCGVCMCSKHDKYQSQIDFLRSKFFVFFLCTTFGFDFLSTCKSFNFITTLIIKKVDLHVWHIYCTMRRHIEKI